MDQGLHDAARIRANAKADADRLLAAASVYGDRVSAQTEAATDRLEATAEQFGEGLVAFAEANRKLLLNNVKHGLAAIDGRADVLAAAIRNAGEAEARRIERVRDANIDAINSVFSDELAAAIAARDAALAGAKDRYEFAVLGWTPQDLASKAAIGAAFDQAVREADARRVAAIGEQDRMAAAGVVSTREIAAANADGLLGYAASGSQAVLVQATRAADALVVLAGTQARELVESADAAVGVLESRAETERERVMWHTFAQMNAVTASAEQAPTAVEEDAAVRANEVRNATAAATLAVVGNVNAVVKDMVADAWMLEGSTAAGVGQRPPEVVTAAQMVTVHAATVDYFSDVAASTATAASGVVKRSATMVVDADRTVDVSIAAFMAMSRAEQARFLSDERALAAWFLGVLGGQASADADRLETAAAGMHADLAAAVRTLLAEVERRGRDGVDAVRDHAAGVVTDMSVAMREAVAQIRDLLRTAAARYAVDIDRLYAKVDEQGRDNLAEFVAALDRAKPDTTPAPPVTRWPDDDGPVPSISLRDEIEAIYADNRSRIVRQIEELEERKAALVEEVGTYFRMTRDPSGSEVMHISLVQDEIIEIEARLPPLQRVLDDNEKVIQFEYGGLATKISVVHGDLWDADSVTVLLPGTGSTIQNFGKTSENAIELRKAQLEAAPGRKAVVIAALCYEAPTGPDVDAVDMVGDFKSGGFLERAGDDIAEFIQSVPMPDGATLNAVGHSYGSTALGQATVSHGLVWDNVVLAGSPGAVARSADEFGGDVFAAALPGDPITGIGDSVFGDWGFPYGAEFGATILGEYDPPQYYEEYPDGLRPGVTNFDMSQHSNYFVKGSTMLKEIARATVDR